MLLVIPVSHVDYRRAVELVEWIGDLDEYRKHTALLVSSKTLSDQQVDPLIDGLREALFARVSAIRLRHEDTRGWPYGPNLMFSSTVEYISSARINSPFFWLEPDALPLRGLWLDDLQKEYVRLGKPFMGALFDKPWPHMVGVAVYPPDIRRLNPFACHSVKLPFDTVRPDLTLPFAARTKLIEHQWGVIETNTPPSFPTYEDLNRIPKEAVVFHRCKDGSLLEKLRVQRPRIKFPEPPLPEKEETESIDLGVFNFVQSSASLPPIEAKERIPLKNVTLWSACCTNNPELTGKCMRVLRYCCETFAFGQVVMFTHAPINFVPDFPVEIVQVPAVDLVNGWNIFVNRVAPLAFKCDYAMSVHEDGFPLNPHLWSDEFLKHDYIGAPWQDGVVGNGGFNIESRRLLTEKMKLPPYDRVIPSDFYVCRVYRKELEERGISFAPKELAIQFSAETIRGDGPSFGFHGRKRNPSDYRSGWKLIQSSESVSSIRMVVIYVHVPGEGKRLDESRRFVKTYLENPPGSPHRTIIVSQKTQPCEEARKLFSCLPNVEYYVHDNTGHDIGAYIALGRIIKDDMMVCCGSSAFFIRPGWLARYRASWLKHGPGMYGPTATYEVSPHLNTTGFACPPKVLAAYPVSVVNKPERYNFEHGPDAFWKYVADQGLPVKLVTWCGEYDWPDWRKPPNIFRRGDQTNSLLCWHHHTYYREANADMRKTMERYSDRILDPMFIEMMNHPEIPFRKIFRNKRFRRLAMKNFLSAHRGFK